MMPQPEVGKHYVLTHKRTGVNLFRGYVQIVQYGYIGDKKIFRICQNDKSWYFWDDYEYEYIGDLA